MDYSEECLIQNGKEEAARADAAGFKIQFELDLASALSLCGNLQLALRHPLNIGTSSEIARRIIDDLRTGLKTSGFDAHAEMIELGDDPGYDYDPRLPPVDDPGKLESPPRVVRVFPCDHQWDGPRMPFGEAGSVASCSLCGEVALRFLGDEDPHRAATPASHPPRKTGNQG
jgi:hypothetical protein